MCVCLCGNPMYSSSVVPVDVLRVLLLVNSLEQQYTHVYIPPEFVAELCDPPPLPPHLPLLVMNAFMDRCAPRPTARLLRRPWALRVL